MKGLKNTGRNNPKPATANNTECRRQRIAAGSGTSVHQVNQLLKQFFGMQKMMKRMGDFKMKDIVKLGKFNNPIGPFAAKED
ncbi:hypothetical protein ISS37_03725 [candidate division KSB1 bacterium]|nr:hypothetical protein [candidate division KSB1 bacterium]